MSDTDTQLSELYVWLRDNPEEWPGTDRDAIGDERMSELTNRIIDLDAPSSTGIDASVISLTAATWAITRTPASEGYSLSCRAKDVTAVITNDGTPPLVACAKLWQSGAMSSDVHAAPPLVACVSKGSVAVIPGRDATDCAKQNMTLWAGQADGHDNGSVARSDYQAVGAATQAVRYDLFEWSKKLGTTARAKPTGVPDSKRSPHSAAGPSPSSCPTAEDAASTSATPTSKRTRCTSSRWAMAAPTSVPHPSSPAEQTRSKVEDVRISRVAPPSR